MQFVGNCEWASGSECTWCTWMGKWQWMHIVTLVPLDFEKVTHRETRGFHSIGIGDGWARNNVALQGMRANRFVSAWSQDFTEPLYSSRFFWPIAGVFNTKNPKTVITVILLKKSLSTGDGTPTSTKSLEMFDAWPLLWDTGDWQTLWDGGQSYAWSLLLCARDLRDFIELRGFTSWARRKMCLDKIISLVVHGLAWGFCMSCVTEFWATHF